MDDLDWKRLMAGVSSEDEVRACNCMGPQNGEKLCPCALNGLRANEHAMIRDGVEIGGKRYKLIPVGED